MTDTPPSGPRTLPGVERPPVQRAALAVTGVVAVVAVSLAAVLARPSLAALPADGASAGPASAAAVAAPTSVMPTGRTTEVTVTMRDMSFTPSRIEVPAGDALRVRVVNEDDQRHDLVLANGAATDLVAPGASAVLDAGVVAADLAGWCSLPGHRQMGMTLTVVAVGVATAGASAAGHDAMDMPTTSADDPASPTMAELQQAAREHPAYPAELAPLDDSTVHEVTLTVTEATEEVADGLTRTVWTYNGTSPGPVLHGRVGDTFRVTLVNDGSMGHSVDFHAGELAPDGPMRTIEPGESLVYTFTADRAGIWMYHCSTMPMSQHIANGMAGAVVIEPADLPAVDRQYVLVRTEEYLGEDGGTAAPAKVAAGTPDVTTFNGRAFQYDAHPLIARAGERVRVWLLDAGPDLPVAFHVVGVQFDTVWTEGAYLVRNGVGSGSEAGSARRTGAQVLPLLAAQGGFVELVPPEPGHYAFVDHQMNRAEQGSHGVLEVTD